MEKILKELSSMELSGKMKSTAEERTQAAKFLGRLGGKASVKSRFEGLTKKQKSELMRKVRLSKKESEDFGRMVDGCVESLNHSQS